MEPCLCLLIVSRSMSQHGVACTLAGHGSRKYKRRNGDRRFLQAFRAVLFAQLVPQHGGKKDRPDAACIPQMRRTARTRNMQSKLYARRIEAVDINQGKMQACHRIYASRLLAYCYRKIKNLFTNISFWLNSGQMEQICAGSKSATKRRIQMRKKCALIQGMTHHFFSFQRFNSTHVTHVTLHSF